MPSILTTPLDPRHARRIEQQLVLLPVYVWFLFAWIGFAIDISPVGRLDRSGHIKGHDFVHFYVLGQIALDRAPADLYSFDAQAVRTDRLVPEYKDRFLPPHAPQVSLFFAPFALAPYGAALAAWLLISTALYAWCCRCLLTKCSALRDRAGTSMLFCAGYPAFYLTIAAGQTSVFALAWFSLAFLALAGNRPWLAGVALGSLAYKPTLLLVIPIALLYARQWRVLGGAVLAAAAQVAAVLAYFGRSTLLAYGTNVPAVLRSASLLEPDSSQLHSLRAFFTMLIPWPAVALGCYLVAAVLVVGAAARYWRSEAGLDTRFAVLLLATVLVDPHVFGYELVVLAPALALAANSVLSRRRASPLFWLLWSGCYFLPVLGTLARVTHVQFSTAAFLGVTFWIMRCDSSAPAAGTRAPWTQ